MTELLSAEYLALLTEKHRVKPWGGGGASWVPHVLPLVEDLELNAPTFLDYGCGRATFKWAMLEALPSATVFEYDPGIPGKDAQPAPADIVIATDVMEHVEEQFVDATLQKLAALSQRLCFMNIACELSKSLLPDGQNAHITVRPPDWWIDKIKRNFGKAFEIRVYERRSKRTVIAATRRQ